MNQPTSAGRVIYGKPDADVILNRVDSALCLVVMSVEKIDQLHRVLDAYLNTRAEAPQWLYALSDAHVGAAIAAMHRQPARRWTVATLAGEVGMSRSGFAARFAELVGDGPIEYLTRWRMLLAGRSLSRGEAIGTVARCLFCRQCRLGRCQYPVGVHLSRCCRPCCLHRTIFLLAGMEQLGAEVVDAGLSLSELTFHIFPGGRL